MTEPTYRQDPGTGQLTLTLGGAEYVAEECRGCKDCAFNSDTEACCAVVCWPPDLDEFVIWVRKP